MARTNNLTNFLNDVATAIKQKLGDNTPIPASQFDSKIGEIETGGNYQTKSISITTNGNYTQLPDTGYDAMDQVVISVNVPQTGGDVKLFETEQAMQTDINPEEGDLAIVKRINVTPINVNSKLSTVKILHQVTLTSPITEEFIMCTFRNRDTYSELRFEYYDGNLFISTYGDNARFSGRYTTEDGLTYTLNDYDTDQVIDIGSVVECEYPNEWNDIISLFISSYQPYFGGLFEYTLNYEDKSKVHFLLTSGLNIDSSDTITIKDNAFDSTYYDVETFRFLANKITEDFDVSMYSGGYMPRFFLQDGDLCFIMLANAYLFGSGLLIDTNYNTVGFSSGDLSIYGNVYVYKITDIDTGTYILKNTYTGIRGNNNSYVLIPNIESCTIGFAAYDGGTISLDTVVRVYDNGSMQSTYKTIQDMNVYKHDDLYLPAKTQCDLVSANQILPGITGYGNGGIITGNNSVYDNLDWNTIWTNYNMLDDNNHKLIGNTTNKPIISYNGNSNTKDTYTAYSTNIYSSSISPANNYGGPSCAKIGTNKYFVTKTVWNSPTQYWVITINPSDYSCTMEQIQDTINVTGTISSVAFDDTNGYIYISIADTTNKQWHLERIDINDNYSMVDLYSVAFTEEYFKSNICIPSSAVYIDGTSGFYKISFSGTKTLINSHYTWC